MDKEITDPETGEVMAVISLGTWELIVKAAKDTDPCEQCGSNGCETARRVLAVEKSRNRE